MALHDKLTIVAIYGHNDGDLAIPSLLVNNDNVSSDFNNIVRKMLAKKPEDRPQDMWDVLKMVRTTPIFKKPPRIPSTNPFDDYQGGGRIEPAS